MDGPNVNLKFLKELKSYMEAESYSHVFIDIGSCTLQVVQGSFKTGLQATDWKIAPFLRSIYNVFKISSARCDDYTKEGGGKQFPKKFCSVRWLENKPALSRAIEILPNIRTYLGYLEKEKKLPSTPTFKIIQEGANDPLQEAKLAFCITIIDEIEPFLR